MGALEIYVLNVGQADTAIVKSPGGKIVVIDAYEPHKIAHVLDAMLYEGEATEPEIAHLIVTHPHYDHYRAVPAMFRRYAVKNVILGPLWHQESSKGYQHMIHTLQTHGVPVRLVAGYERTYPDENLFDEQAMVLEMLGPPNHLLAELDRSKALETNHLSIITRLSYGKFSMVFPGDAQMENWAYYDREGMLGERCDVMMAAHHGSKHGAQWERLARLSPRLVIVAADPESHHRLPDLIGAATFLEYEVRSRAKVALTAKTGTIRITVPKPDSRRFQTVCYGDTPKETPVAARERPLPDTGWRAIVEDKLDALAKA